MGKAYQQAVTAGPSGQALPKKAPHAPDYRVIVDYLWTNVLELWYDDYGLSSP